MRLSIRQYALALLDIERETAGNEMKEIGKRFISWLIRRGEAKKLGKIVTEAERIARQRKGEVEVTVTTGQKVSRQTEELLLSRAEALFPEKKIGARFVTDTDVIGGMRIQSDEMLYDATLKEQLKMLEKRLR